MSEPLTIRVVLPQHLRTLANVDREVAVQVSTPVTQRTLLDALEKKYPVLEGAIREHVTYKRRALVRFFACQEDLSHDDADLELPAAVQAGREQFVILGAIAGG